MFDTMTLTKIVAGFCGSFLVFLLGVWAAEEIYHVGGGHGDVEQAYSVELPEGEGDAEPEVEAGDPPVEELLASADVGAGERVFGKCRACHQLEQGANAVGPYLYGVVGREVGAAEGYAAYSGALSEHFEVWDATALYDFLKDPRGTAPGTSMSFNGLPDPEDRANLIAYLDATDG
ncbi:c-type cytochrome [Palleronia sediminis]|uniref:C-type cytochrome n=1 Tax=Palleronia sediminis TaxID=2547833 RepID=A0A4R6A616_9RHOB|nr:c-type cytochrome [Palleronia sediminis]TDL76233.1 c-type cytochrome [Palleronia sediminis]